MKKIIIFVLAAIYALGICACGNSNERTVSASEYNILMEKLDNIENELKNLKLNDLNASNNGSNNTGASNNGSNNTGENNNGSNNTGGNDTGSNNAGDNIHEDIGLNGDGDANDDANGDQDKDMMPYEHAYIQKSIYLTNIMINVAKDGDYMKLFTVDPSMENFVELYGTIDASMLNRAIVLNFSNFVLDEAIEKAAEGEVKLSADLAQRMRARVLPLLPNLLNVENGSLSLAFLSTIQQNDAFIKPAGHLAEGNILVVLLYGSGSSVTNKTFISLVSFRDSMEGTIIGSAGFVDDPDGTLSGALYGDRKSILTMLDRVEELTISKDDIDCAIYEAEQLESIPAYNP